ITTVTPSSGSWTGGYPVVIAGTNLADPTDLTDITLAGVTATVQSVSSTQVVVVAGSSGMGSQTGDVRLVSSAYGVTMQANGFAYTEAQPMVLGTNGAVVASGEEVSGEKGTRFGNVLVGASVTNRMSVTNPGLDRLQMSGSWTAGGAHWSAVGLPTFVDAGTVSNVSLAFAPMAAGDLSGVFVMTNNTVTGVYTVNVAGAGFTVTPDNGPLAGGSVARLDAGALGNGSDITAVTVGGIPMRIRSQGSTWVEFMTDVFASSGVKEIVVTSTSQGEALFPDCYRVNPVGEVGFWEHPATNWSWRSVGDRVVPGQLTAVGADNNVSALHWHDGILYAGGAFDNIGASNINRIGFFDGTNWNGFGDTVVDGNVLAIQSHPDGFLAGGDFSSIGGTSVRGIARWTGTNWVGIGNGAGLEYTPGAVGRANCIVPYTNGSFIVGGYFTNVNGMAGMNHVALYDGNNWTNLGQGFNNEVLSVAVGSDGTVYAGGNFTEANRYQVARWNGQSWTNMGGGFSAVIRALTVMPNGDVYAGGSFNSVYLYATNDATRAARSMSFWDASSQTWTNAGGGVSGWVYALAAGHEENLYAGGTFSRGINGADDVTVNRVAMWDGLSWTNLANGVSSAMNPQVSALAVNRNDGTLYAGGSFTSASGSNCWRIAQWVPEVEGWNIGVSPSSGSGMGGYQVTIRGSNLADPSDPSDLSAVTICGASVTGIVSATSTQIVVWAGPAITAGTGDVVIVSRAYGSTVAPNAFRYNAPIIQVLGTSGAIMESGAGVSPASGTQFPHIPFGTALTNTFAITNAGTETLTLVGYGLSDMRFGLSDLPPSVPVGGVSHFAVTFTPDAAGDFAAVLQITNNSPSSVFTLNLAGSCYAITAGSGPLQGGNTITITNGNFGGITNVLVGARSASILLASSNSFTITLPAAQHAGVVDISVQTWDRGETLLHNAYTYNPAGTISRVAPASGSWTGGYEVVIEGANLSDASDLSDLSDVTLAGVTATVQSVSATQIVVTAGAALAPHPGDVRTVSASYGQTVMTNAFRYTGSGMVIGGLNNAPVASGGLATYAAGTDFGHRLPNLPVTNRFTIINTGDEPLTLAGYGMTHAAFSMIDFPDVVAAGATGHFSVVFEEGIVGRYTAVLSVTNNSPVRPFVLNLAGGVYGIDPDNGPYAGGNTVTITNGSFGSGTDISKVKIGNAGADVLAQGLNWVTIRVPGQQHIGDVDIEITSDSLGVARLPAAYRYNAPGAIFGAEDWTQWQEVRGLPAARSELAAGVLDGTLYAIGGTDGTATKTNVYAYTGYDWAEVAGLPEALAETAVVSFGNYLYAAGGRVASNLLSANIYSFDSDSWGTTTGVLSGVTAMAAATNSTGLLLFGGRGANTYSRSSVIGFDGVTWDNASSLPSARHALAGACLQDHVYALGGIMKLGKGNTVMTNVYAYSVGQWFEVAGLPEPRSGLAAATLDNKLYAIGGFNNNRPWTNVWRYSGSAWSEAPGLPAARYAHAAAVRDGIVYAIGGSDGETPVTNVFRYPATETGVSPSSGSVLGGYTVVINGTNLCDGTLGDVTNVTLCGVAATVTAVQGATQIVVQAGSGTAGPGDVRIHSQRFGETVRGSAFTYIATPEIVVLGTNGTAIESGAGVSPASGSDFGSVYIDSVQTRTLMITNSGDTALTMQWTTNGSAYFSIEVTNAVPYRTAVPMTLRYAATAMGVHTATVVIANNSTNTPYLLNLAGTTIDPQIGLIGKDGVGYADDASASVAIGSDFGMVVTGEVAWVSLAITNAGRSVLEISGHAFAGQGAGAFSVSNLPATVAAGTAEPFLLYFRPLELKPHPVTLVLTNNTTGMVFRVRASGLGARAGEIGLNRSKLTFLATYGGQDPTSERYAITNRGDISFNYSNTVSYGTGAADWLTFSRYSGVLSSGSLHQVTGAVSIAGLNAGVYYATNRVTSPTAANSPVDLLAELTVEKANQSLTFTNLGAQVTTNATLLVATATSGLPVSFAVVSGAASVENRTNGTYVTYSGAGEVSIAASQTGNGNWLAAAGVTNTFPVSKAVAGVVFTNLMQTYDGETRMAGTTTAPTGLTVNVRYDAQKFAPVNAGSYAVSATVSDEKWQGTATGLLVVAKAEQAITNVTPTNASAFVTTDAVTLEAEASSGLPCTFELREGPGTLDVDQLTFTGTGAVVVVVAQVGDENWRPAVPVSNVYHVVKAATELTLGSLEQTYDGAGKQVSIKRNPNSLAVRVTYAGTTNLPVNVGLYAVTSVVDDVIYQGAATGELQIVQSGQTIDFVNPGAQVTTNATLLTATASSGLPVSFAVVSGAAVLENGTNGTYATYVGAGDVSIVALQAGNSNWLAAAGVTQSFSVVKAPQAPLVFVPATPQVFGITNGLSASGGSSTGTFSFVVSQGSGNGEITGGTNLVARSGSGEIVVMAIKSADDLYAQVTALATVVCAKASQTISFPVVADQHLTNQPGLVATASSGLEVGFRVVSGPAVLVDATNLAFTGTGMVSMAATQEGDSNYAAATSVTNTFEVYAGVLQLRSIGGLLLATNAPSDWALGTDFGVIPTNQVRTLDIILTNASPSRTVNITGVTTNGAAYFSIANVPSELAAGASATSTVFYAPGGLGLHEASFVLANDTLDTPYIVNVSGAGAIPGELALRAAKVTWQTSYGNTNPVMQVFDVGNTGGVAIAYDMGIFYEGEPAGWITLNATNGMLPATNWLSFTGTVNAAGMNAGVYYATNIITSTNAVNSPQQMWFRMVVDKGTQTIDFAQIADQEATNRLGLRATASSGLPVVFGLVQGSPATLTEGTNLVFTGMGTVQVTASQAGNTNWAAAPVVTNTFHVTKVNAGITIGNTNQTYTGIIRQVSVTTAPTGLAVQVTYNGSAFEPIHAGTYEVVVTVDDDYYQGSKTGTLHV
ncbi:MAG TPA: hypothetical protein DCS43_05195, partial [Verrucomicrobia bacterium]|nr:hypothetical protein [Verrucomicrobiota bacterium]